MKTETTNQEILLFAGASFFSRPYWMKEPDNEEAAYCFKMENLEKACWAGILNEILPELVSCSSPGNKNYLWKILIGSQFLKVNMGACPRSFENETSIDPYSFLSTAYYN